MKTTATVQFVSKKNQVNAEIEIPLNITANELIIALDGAYRLGMNTENIFDCFLVAENPIAFLKGNKTLEEFGIRNGTVIMYTED